MISQLHIARFYLTEDNLLSIKITPGISVVDKRQCGVFQFESEYIYGCIINRNGLLIFNPENMEILPDINKEYNIADSYWVNLIELVLSSKKVWKKIKFSAEGIFDYEKRKIIKTFDGKYLDSDYVKKQLNHEHCEICMEKITINSSIGYYSDPYNYLCQKCWNNYKVNRNISFVNWDQDLA